MSSGEPSLWLPRWRADAGVRLRLFCFPHAGAGASVFRGWLRMFPEELALCPVQLPGRENRHGERPLAELSEVLDALEGVIGPYTGEPFAFFGHSMGALIAFELARRLRRRGYPEPSQLFVSSRDAPHRVRVPETMLHLASEAEILDRLRQYGQTPEELLSNARLMRRLMPLFRADARVTETAGYTVEPPLSCPIAAFGGLSDPSCTREGMQAWSEQTSGRFSLRGFPGAHFYFQDDAEPLVGAILGECKRTIDRVLAPESGLLAPL